MEREFKVGDKVRVVSVTLAHTDNCVGSVGVVEMFDRFDMTCRVKTDKPYTSLWHHSSGLELVTEPPKPTPQKLNSQYCLDVKEVLKQTREAVVDMMCLTHDKIYYADLNSLHTELVRCQGRLEDTARWLDRQEREALERAAREEVTA